MALRPSITFWNAVAPSFLNTAYGCNWIILRQAKDSSGKQGITQAMPTTTGTGCTVNGKANQTMIIRYASKASYDGVMAVQGNTTNPNVSLSDCGAANPYQRKLADENHTSGGTVRALKCVDVTLGASDVRGNTFSQVSHGQIWAPRRGLDQLRLHGSQCDRPYGSQLL